jgi:hypothetical protein
MVLIRTMPRTDKQEAERKRLEASIDQGTSGIIALDLKGDYIPLNPDPKLIDKDTLQFLQSKVLNWYDMPLKIFTGEFNDEDYQAWYEQSLEPILIGLGQAFTPTVFSVNEISFGNEIIFYQRDMMYLSTKAKMELLKTTGEQGLLTDDQKLAIHGYPPLSDGTGNRRTISLNYIDVTLASEYQMKSEGKKRTKEDDDE